jgi:hypothetical protein
MKAFTVWGELPWSSRKIRQALTAGVSVVAVVMWAVLADGFSDMLASSVLRVDFSYSFIIHPILDLAGFS